jgi:hypothetical protein
LEQHGRKQDIYTKLNVRPDENYITLTPQVCDLWWKSTYLHLQICGSEGKRYGLLEKWSGFCSRILL